MSDDTYIIKTACPICHKEMISDDGHVSIGLQPMRRHLLYSHTKEELAECVLQTIDWY